MRALATYILMCLPMFLAAGILFALGAGTAALILALTCALMMIVMVVVVARDERNGRP
jgi:hypothetical protein